MQALIFFYYYFIEYVNTMFEFRVNNSTINGQLYDDDDDGSECDDHM